MGEGFALEWKAQGLVSGDFNGNLNVWKNIEEEASNKYQYEVAIEDSKWVGEDIIVTVGDDGYMNFWDVRQKKIVRNVMTTNNEKKEVYSVAVNPYRNHIILTGGED